MVSAISWAIDHPRGPVTREGTRKSRDPVRNRPDADMLATAGQSARGPRHRAYLAGLLQRYWTASVWSSRHACLLRATV